MFQRIDAQKSDRKAQPGPARLAKWVGKGLDKPQLGLAHSKVRSGLDTAQSGPAQPMNNPPYKVRGFKTLRFAARLLVLWPAHFFYFGWHTPKEDKMNLI